MRTTHDGHRTRTFALVFAGLLLPACGPGPTASVTPEEPGQGTLEAGTEEATRPSHPRAQPEDGGIEAPEAEEQARLERKLEEIRLLLEQGRHHFVLAEAENLVAHRGLPAVMRMELHLMIAEAWLEAGDEARASEELSAYTAILEQIRRGDVPGYQDTGREKLFRIVEDRLKAQALGLELAGVATEPPPERGLVGALARAGPSEVLKGRLADGAPIMFSRDPAALGRALADAGAAEAAVQWHPRRRFYYVIEEPAAPSGSSGWR